MSLFSKPAFNQDLFCTYSECRESTRGTKVFCGKHYYQSLYNESEFPKNTLDDLVHNEKFLKERLDHLAVTVEEHKRENSRRLDKVENKQLEQDEKMNNLETRFMNILKMITEVQQDLLDQKIKGNEIYSDFIKRGLPKQEAQAATEVVEGNIAVQAEKGADINY